MPDVFNHSLKNAANDELILEIFPNSIEAAIGPPNPAHKKPPNSCKLGGDP